MKKKGIIGIGVVLLLLVLWIAAGYCGEEKDVFASHTTINGVDCSGLTVEETVEALTQANNSKTLTVTEGDQVLAEITEVDITYDIQDQVEELLQKSHSLGGYLWHGLGGGRNKTISMVVASMTDEKQEELENLEFLQVPYTTATTDAYLDMSNVDFLIVEEVQGDQVDPARFVEAVMDCYATDNMTLEFAVEDYYKLPQVTSQDTELLERQTYCKTYLSHTITLTCWDGNVTLTPEEMDALIVVENGQVSVDSEAVATFVAQLAKAHNTVGTARSFTTATGSVIRVSGGNYGYTINQSQEIAQLTEDLLAQKDVTRAPMYTTTAYGGSTGVNGDIGNSYVEICISSQMLYLYKNGTCLLSTSVVTGNSSLGYDTPTGVFRVTYKTTDATLTGTDYDGSEYSSPVSYWMPFYGNYGMHDASWRSVFGGTIYQTNGSHGCVNMPLEAASVVYSNVSAGFPVIVYP